MLAFRLVAALHVAALIPWRSDAQTVGAEASHVIAPGVIHRRITRPEGPWVINILEVDLRRDELRVESARAHDALRGRERTSSIAERRDAPCTKVLAALNADFFDLATGETENNQVIDGTLVKGQPVTASPHDTFDNTHSQFAIAFNGRPLIDRFVFDGAWLSRWGPVALGGVNAVPHADALVLYTSIAGDSTPGDTPRRARAELALRRVASRGDTAAFRAYGAVRVGATPIPDDGAVIVGFGASAAAIHAMARTPGPIRMVLSLAPHQGPLRALVGGWPRILRGGESIAAIADSVEGTFPRFSAGRHPRSAVAFSRDSTTLFLVAVDGRSEVSVGMTLDELAALIRSIGAYDALNLDGGGSTTMVVEGQVVNTPSDPSGERPVGNALLVVRRPPGDRCSPR